MENGVCNLANGLAARGIETHVACLERPGAFAQRIPVAANVHTLGKKQGFSVRATWNLARLIRRIRPSLLHTHNLGPLIYAGLGTLSGRLCPIIHGEHSQLAPWELTPRRLRQRSRLYGACKAIHTVSEAQKIELLGINFPPEKIRSIPNGVDTERFSPDERGKAKTKLGIPADASVIGLVGRFGPFKRHDALLEAFRDVAATNPSAHLVFVGGGGSEESRIRSLAEGNERVHIAGFRSDPEEYYRAMDLLAIPSSNEGMSNAALEAMACGVPALVNIGCGHDQIISNGQDGVIANLATPAEIAAEIGILLSQNERLVDMGKRARATVVARFSMQAMLDAYEQLYRAHAR
jgi:glycosyltransferase involved in cell wall biosynthesis